MQHLRTDASAKGKQTFVFWDEYPDGAPPHSQVETPPATTKKPGSQWFLTTLLQQVNESDVFSKKLV